jgi:hypothetical protein
MKEKDHIMLKKLVGEDELLFLLEYKRIGLDAYHTELITAGSMLPQISASVNSDLGRNYADLARMFNWDRLDIGPNCFSAKLNRFTELFNEYLDNVNGLVTHVEQFLKEVKE